MTTKAESIMSDVVTTIQGIQDGGSAMFKKVETRWPTYEELTQFPSTLFPLVAVVPQLPKPEELIYRPDSRDRGFHLMRAKSRMRFRLHLYAYENVTPLIGGVNYMDVLWRTLLVDPTRGGTARNTEVEPLEMTVYAPFLSLLAEVRVLYEHDKTTI
jgi:hypothetical protein